MSVGDATIMSGPGAYFLNLTNNGLMMMDSVWVTETGDAMELGDS